MEIVRLEIERTVGHNQIVLLRRAVALKRGQHQNIKMFVDHAKYVCDLQGDYDIIIQGYVLPQKQSIDVLLPNTIYKLKQRSENERYIIEEVSCIVENREKVSEKERDFKQNHINNGNQQKVSKKDQKINKILQKEKEELRKSIQNQAQIHRKEQSSSSEELPHLSPKVNKEKKVVVNKKQTKQVSSSQSQQQSSETPVVKARLQTKVIKPEPKVITTKQITQQVKPKPQQKKSIRLSTINSKKATVSDSSSSQSEPSPQIQKIKPKKIQVVSETPLESKKDNLKIPPALRNKGAKPPAVKSFQKYRQNQWLVVDKEKLKRWQEKGQKLVCRVNNKIRFKIVELDEQKFIPVKSTWIVGEVKQILQNARIKLINVQQQGREYRQFFQIQQHNMDELQLSKHFATKEQIQVFDNDQPHQQTSQQLQSSVPKAQIAAIVKEDSKDSTSIQKYICGQINYYFSDKNYLVDFFTQMHANNHPQKYIKLSFMLNYPKIKKILREEQKLYIYLKQDEKYSERSYEIDFQQRLIRKKGIMDAPAKVDDKKNEQEEE